MSIITEDMISDKITRKDLLPLSFLKKSAYTGSKRDFNYRLEKTETVLRAYWWEGKFAFDATPEEDKTYSDFEFSDSGIGDAVSYLNEMIIGAKVHR